MRLQFILAEIGIGLRRNLSMTVSVILVTFVSLTFVGSAALLQSQIGKMKDDWYDKVEVSVFLCPRDSSEPTCAGGEVTDAQKADIEAALDAVGLRDLADRELHCAQQHQDAQPRRIGQSGEDLGGRNHDLRI